MLLGGCGLAMSSEPQLENVCKSDADCEGHVCEEDRCIALEPEDAISVVFEVFPADPSGTDTVEGWTSAPAEVLASGSFDVDLPQRIEVTGSVTWMGHHVPVDVIFTPTPTAPNAPVNPLSFTSQTADFRAGLEPTRMYTLDVRPTSQVVDQVDGFDPPYAGREASEVFPPLRIIGIRAEDLAAGGDSARLDVQYPATLFTPCMSSVIEGCELSGEVVVIDALANEEMASGMSVQAFSTVDGRRVSSSAISEDGLFTIRIAPNAGPYVLRVTPGTTGTPIATVESALGFVFPGETPRILVPLVAPASYLGVVAYDDGGVLNFLNGATLVFESETIDDLDTGVGGSYRTTAVSGSTEEGEGRFEVDLLPGTYRVIITPGDANRAGIAVRELSIAPRSAGAEVQGSLFEVPLRTFARGSVQTFQGEAAPLTLIRARRAPISSLDADLDEPVVYGRTSETFTDVAGEFDLPLDVSTYDVVVQPDASSGFGWHIVTGVGVAEGQQDFALSMTLEPPVVLTGLLRNVAGSPLPGALLRVYEVIDDEFGARTILIGEATSDEEGIYRARLPALTVPAQN